MITTSVRASELRNQIVIEGLPFTISRNANGSEARTGSEWQPLCNAGAKIDTQGGREFFNAKQLNTELTHEITIRWQPGIVTKMRVRFDDPVEGVTRYFDIRAIVNPNNQTRWILLLHCRELVGREIQT